MKKKVVVFAISAIYIFIQLSVSVFAIPAAPGIDAASAILVDVARGQVLYKKNPDERLHIATASKIMTAIIAMEKSRLDSLITVSKESANTEGAMLKLIVGEKYTVESLEYAILLTNANDATNALSEYIGGDLDSFVEMMNDYSAKLNLTNTVFKNPTGLFNEEQYTTAYDHAALLRYALNSSPDFNRIFGTQAKPWYDKEKTLVLANQNNMFWSYDGVDGGKVGFNDPALHSCITTVTRGNQRLLCIVLDSPKDSMYTDTTKLLDYGFGNFNRGILVSKGYPVDKAVVESKEVNMVPISDVYYTYPLGENYIENFTIQENEANLHLPLYTNTVIGNAKYTLTDGTVISTDLYPDKELLPELTQWQKVRTRLSENKELLYIVGILAAIEILLVIYNISKGLQKLSDHRRHKNNIKHISH